MGRDVKSVIGGDLDVVELDVPTESNGQELLRFLFVETFHFCGLLLGACGNGDVGGEEQDVYSVAMVKEGRGFAAGKGCRK
jgi:hypothetical protein